MRIVGKKGMEIWQLILLILVLVLLIFVLIWFGALNKNLGGLLGNLDALL